jgi:hypothetical protein
MGRGAQAGAQVVSNDSTFLIIVRNSLTLKLDAFLTRSNLTVRITVQNN